MRNQPVKPGKAKENRYAITPVVSPKDYMLWTVRLDAPAESNLAGAVYTIIARTPEDAAKKARKYADEHVAEANAMGRRYKRGWPATVIDWQPMRLEGMAD